MPTRMNTIETLATARHRWEATAMRFKTNITDIPTDHRRANRNYFGLFSLQVAAWPSRRREVSLRTRWR